MTTTPAPVEIRAGLTARISFQLVDPGLPASPFSPPASPLPYDPPAAPQITIADCGGNVVVNRANMNKAASGAYYYDFVTPSAGPTGTWSAWLDMQDASGNPQGSLKYRAFIVV